MLFEIKTEKRYYMNGMAAKPETITSVDRQPPTGVPSPDVRVPRPEHPLMTRRRALRVIGLGVLGTGLALASGKLPNFQGISPVPTESPDRTPESRATATPDVTASPEATPPKDALDLKLDAWLSGEMQITEAQRWRNTRGTDLVALKFNAVDTIPSTWDAFITMQTLILGFEEYNGEGFIYTAQEDANRGRFFIRQSVGRIRDDEFVFVGSLSKRIPNSAADPNTPRRTYKTSEFASSISKYFDDPLLVLIPTLLQDINQTGQYKPRFEHEFEDVASHLKINQKYFEWDKAVNEWSSWDRAIPPELAGMINKRKAQDPNGKEIYAYSFATGLGK